MEGDHRSYALQLAALIKPEDEARWRSGSTVGWANESYEIASQLIYQQLTLNDGALSDSYATTMLPVVVEQLKKAGVRLAALLAERQE
jgi:hypothetical protein